MTRSQTRPLGSLREAPRHQQNPYLFVVGCQRSGTTLLQRMLHQHPQLAVGYDSHFIPRAVKSCEIGFDPPLTEEIIADVESFPRFARLGLPEGTAREVAEGCSTYSEFVSAIYDAFARLHGKLLAGEKSPGYCRHLPHLHALFPWARTIHLVRDGRDVALSMLDWKKGPVKLELWKDEPVATCALWWVRDVITGRREGSNLGPARYREVQYEALVERPEEKLRELAEFLHLPFSEQMLKYHEGKTRQKEGLSAKAAWLPPTSGLRDWRTQMDARDLELFEAIAGDALEGMGYDRAVERISPEIAEVAHRCRRWWEQHMERRQGRARRRDAVAVTATTPAPTADAAAASTSSNPFVFVVGCPRSGTTLLKRIIDAHPQIAITPETHWIPRFYKKRIGVTREGLVTEELLPALLDYYKFKNLKLDPGDVERMGREHVSRPYAQFVSGIFDLFGQRHGKQLVGDKTPGYVQDISVLHELWPDAKFIHLIRDGRDVCLSMLEWDRAHRTAGRYGTWKDDPVSTTALWWERFVRLGRESGQELGPEMLHEIRYESLVTNPVAECTALCTFLGLPYDEAMVRFHEGRTKPGSGRSAKSAWLPLMPGVRDWRSQMTPDQVEVFEAMEGDFLDEMGYERAVSEVPAARLEAAARIRAAFSADPRLERRRMPNQW